MSLFSISPICHCGLGNPIRFQLSADTALLWLYAVDHSADNQVRHQLLATCPEALIWSVLQSAESTAEQCCLSTLNSALMNASFDSVTKDDEKIVCLPNHLSESFAQRLQRTDCDLVELTTAWHDLLKDVGLLESAELAQALTQDLHSQLCTVANHLLPEIELDSVLSRRLGSHQTDQSFEKRLLEEKLASMKQLAYGASHEINNPLANIASRAQTLLRDEKDPDRRRTLAKINEQAFRAHEMIADMMLFAHPPQPEITNVNAGQLVEHVRRVIDELQTGEPDPAPVEIKNSAQGDDQFELDEVQFSEAVKAVIKNSLEATAGSGTIQVELRKSEESLEVLVSDNGPGVDAAQQKHMFDPYYSGREAGRGLGFGLSKAWRIAQLHGGEISQENLPSGGAQFCLRIPYRGVLNVSS